MTVAEFVVRHGGARLVPDVAAIFHGAPVRFDPAPASLFGERIVFTGDLGVLGHVEAKILAVRAGASTADRVDATTSALVAGSDPGTRLLAARALGIRVVSVDDFLALAGVRS